MKRICVFCGSRRGRGEDYAELAVRAAQTIVRAGYGIVYGGGSVGLMGIIADTALACGGEVIGVIPRALATVEIAHPNLAQLHIVETMHERKSLMSDFSDAFIALPGGFGTMDELCEALSWRQLGIHDKPVGVLNHRQYYDALLRLFDEMVEQGFLTPANRALLVAANDIDGLLQQLF
jgi:uncharacterized protein (TIGR00730 family)